jgi:hypothetical protein
LDAGQPLPSLSTKSRQAQTPVVILTSRDASRFLPHLNPLPAGRGGQSHVPLHLGGQIPGASGHPGRAGRNTIVQSSATILSGVHTICRSGPTIPPGINTIGRSSPTISTGIHTIGWSSHTISSGVPTIWRSGPTIPSGIDTISRGISPPRPKTPLFCQKSPPGRQTGLPDRRKWSFLATGPADPVEWQKRLGARSEPDRVPWEKPSQKRGRGLPTNPYLRLNGAPFVGEDKIFVPVSGSAPVIGKKR